MNQSARDGQPPAGRLLKVLGVAFGLAVLVGNTIGMGILRTPGEVAARLPSVPLFMAVWVAGAVYALLGALTVAELAAMRPRSGGLYPWCMTRSVSIPASSSAGRTGSRHVAAWPRLRWSWVSTRDPCCRG